MSVPAFNITPSEYCHILKRYDGIYEQLNTLMGEKPANKRAIYHWTRLFEGITLYRESVENYLERIKPRVMQEGIAMHKANVDAKQRSPSRG